MANNIPGGYNGKILRADLTRRAVQDDAIDESFYRKYLGGTGFISYYLLNELQPGTDPLGLDNKLIFALGPVTGTPMIGSGRNGVGAKSPISEGIALSQVGEFWGAELKHAGYDAIVIEGKADKPVYLWITDGRANIRDAGHLWGKETKETERIIRDELGDDKVRIAMIGPAGENMTRFACIMVGLFDAAGRGGLGAVMGSKNLKAIAVRGHNAPRVINPDNLININRWYSEIMYKVPVVKGWHDFGTGFDMDTYEKTGDLPIHNWRDGIFPGVENITAVTMNNTIGIGMDGCFTCPVRCKKRVKVEEPFNVDPDYGGPEYESISAFGSNCGVDDIRAIAKCNERCNALSLDVISTGGVISFAMECFEKGLITLEDTGGIELRFGNHESIITCIEMIARREGFGAILAEGTANLAKRIGHDSADFAMHVKGLDAGQHEPRLYPTMGLGFMINPHGADHCCNVIDGRFLTEAGMRSVNYLGFHEPFTSGDISPRKVALFRFEHLKQVLYDSALLCHLMAVPLTIKRLVDIIEAVTGWDTSIVELLTIAERALTTARLFNIREGFTAEDDRLPKRYFQPRVGGALSDSLDFDQMEKARRYYYTLMGWNRDTGVPLPEKLEELGINYL